MTPFQTVNGLEALFSLPPVNGPQAKVGRAPEGMHTAVDGMPFREVLHAVDKRDVHRSTKTEKPAQVGKPSQNRREAQKSSNPNQTETPEKAERSSAGKTVETQETTGSAAESASLEESEVLSPETHLDEGEDVENVSPILPFPLRLEITQDPALWRVEEQGLEAVLLETEPLLTSGADTQDISGATEDIVAKLMDGQSPPRVARVEGVLISNLKERAGTEGESEGAVEKRLSLEDNTLFEVLKGNQSEAKAELASKPNLEGAIKGAEKGLAEQGEQAFTGEEPQSDQEKKEGVNGLTTLSKAELKILSSDTLGLQEANSFDKAPSHLSLNLPQKEAILSQVQEQLKVFQGGKSEQIRFQLEPESLGTLQIELTVQKGGVVAQIITADPQVKALLEANQGQLRDRLAEQGFRVDQFSVNVGDMGKFSEEKREALPFQREHRAFPETDLKASVPGFLPARHRGSGFINVYV